VWGDERVDNTGLFRLRSGSLADCCNAWQTLSKTLNSTCGYYLYYQAVNNNCVFSDSERIFGPINTQQQTTLCCCPDHSLTRDCLRPRLLNPNPQIHSCLEPFVFRRPLFRAFKAMIPIDRIKLHVSFGRTGSALCRSDPGSSL